MVKKRRGLTAGYKFRIAQEALEGSERISQLSSEHEINANLGSNLETAAAGRRAQRQALSMARPKIFNTAQGAQFTADAFTACLLAANVQVSMDGRGRLDAPYFSRFVVQTLGPTI